MDKKISGFAYVLGNNVDTDQIIPAEHLVYSMSDEEESKKYGQYALSSVPKKEAGLPHGGIPFVEEGKNTSLYNIIIAGANFGCGSSREHAPYAINKAGCNVVIAESYARIFYRNAVDGGFLVPYECELKLNDKIHTGDKLEIDFERNMLIDLSDHREFKLKPLGDVLPIIEAGGLFEYARKTGMIKTV